MAEARFILQSRKVDIVLLDIFLQDGLGLELAKWLRKQDSKCALIFITTSRDYAVESYEVNACYYLLKPLEETEFLKALQKASSQFGSQDYLVVTHDYNDIRIRYTDINYIEADHKQAIFYFKDGTNTTSYINLDDLAKKLWNHHIIRCHRSYMVNLVQVADVKKTEVLLLNGKSIPLSRGNYLTVKREYEAYLFQSLRKY